MWPDRIKIVEVGPRDGLQNEATPIPTAVKSTFIAKLVAAGLKDIEVTAFVHPKTVPQLADAADVVRALPRAAEVTFSALVPNEKGLERAVEAGLKRIAVFTAASEAFTQKNIRMSIEESMRVYREVVRSACAIGLSVRGYVSTAFVCPYEGDIPKEQVRPLVEQLLEMGVDEVAVSDTIGAAAPTDIRNTVGFILDRLPAARLALHFHDTFGTALANVCAGMELGISTFDTSAGGLGGCPFAPGAAGNLATEDLVYLLDRMGFKTGVDVNGVVDAAGVVAEALGREPRSRQWRRLRGARP